MPTSTASPRRCWRSPEGGHADHRPQDLRRRQSAAPFRRPLFHLFEARDRRRHRGRRRGLWRAVRAAHGRAHDRGRVRALRPRRRPVPDRAPVAGRLLRGLQPAPGPVADGRPERHRDGLLGHRRQGASASPSTSCSAAGCTSGCAPTAISTPSRAIRPASTAIPSSPRCAPPSTSPRASRRSSSTRSGRTRPSIRASRRSRRWSTPSAS